MIQSGGFLGRLLGPLLKARLTLMNNVIKSLAKIVWIPLGLTAAASSADAGIHKITLGSRTTTLITSNEENGRYYGNSQISWRSWFIIKKC